MPWAKSLEKASPICTAVAYGICVWLSSLEIYTNQRDPGKSQLRPLRSTWMKVHIKPIMMTRIGSFWNS